MDLDTFHYILYPLMSAYKRFLSAFLPDKGVKFIISYTGMDTESKSYKELYEQERTARQELEKKLEEKNQLLNVINSRLTEMYPMIEEEVQRRTEHLQSFARISHENPEPVLRISFDGNIIFCNEAISKIDREIIYQQKTYVFENFLTKIAQIAKKKKHRIELEIQSKDTYYSLFCVPLIKEDYINIYGRDITVKKQADRILKTTNRRVSTIIANIQAGILVEDFNRRVVLSNQFFCDYFGIPLPPEQLVDMDCNESTQQSSRLFKDPEEFINRINIILKERKLVVDEELELADGRFFERDFIPIYENNEYLGHLWKYEDVTEKRHIEVTLKRSEEKYRRIIENMNLGLMEVDTEETILYANHSFCEMLGYEIEELLGRKATDIFLPAEARHQMNNIHKRRNYSESDAYEIAIKNKQGEHVWMLISGAPLYDEQKVVGSLGIHLDITSQKKMEIDLREAITKAEESSRAKEIFLANMSHEIRTPMNAIMGMSRLLSRTPLNTEQSTFLRAITTSADNLLVIINDILDFSKIEAGKMQIEAVDFQPKPLIEQVAQVLAYKAEEKNLAMSVTIDPRIAPVLIGDPYRINQILLNLAGNAIKFTHQGTIELSIQLLFENPQLQVIRFAVKDTGIGIDSSKLSNIFDSFTQEDNSITRKYGGTGLGLSICKKLIEIMGGSIEIASEKNKGTTVSFTLGFAKSQSDQMPVVTEIEIEYTLEDSHILLVEDNEFNRMLAITLLKNYGATITEAVNGLEAVRKLKENTYDLVLMDIQMPEMTGLEATRLIRNELKKQVPIIALTASALKGEKDKCLQLGMNDYLSKPFDEKELIGRCAWWIAENKKFTPEEIEDKLYDLSSIYDISRGSQEFVQKMIQIFIQSTTEAITTFQRLHEEHDYEQMHKQAHRVKAVIDNMGIESLKQEIREIENVNKGNISPERLDYLIEHFEEVIIKVQHALQQSEEAVIAVSIS